MSVRLLVADDNAELVVECMSVLTGGEMGFATEFALDPQTCLEKVKGGGFDVILLDEDFGPGQRTGTDLIPAIKRAAPQASILMYTNAEKGKAALVEALSAGVDDFAVKGRNGLPEVVGRIQELLAYKERDRASRTAARMIADQVGVVYRAEATERAFAAVAVYKYQNVNVLIQGQTGTGKEGVAQGLARREDRRPFITVNCPGIARNVLMSELFGHERGAFTGATGPRRGLIEEADGGDLFLDEAHMLEDEAQRALLRTIESGEVRRMGSNQTRKVKVRFIAATSVDLAKAVAEGRFLPELYARLSGVIIVLPPLCERREDILPIFNQHLKKVGGKDMVAAPDVEDFLETLPWPTNARQIRNLVQRLVPLVAGKMVTGRHLSNELIAELSKDVSTAGAQDDQRELKLSPGQNLADARDDVTVRLIEATARDLGPKATQKAVAQAVGMPVTNLQRLIEKYNIVLRKR